MSIITILITLWLSGFITGLASGAIVYRKRTQELRLAKRP